MLERFTHATKIIENVLIPLQMFEFCLAPDTTGDGTGCDNMTAIIVKFNKVGALKTGSAKRPASESCDNKESEESQSKKPKSDTTENEEKSEKAEASKDTSEQTEKKDESEDKEKCDS